MLSGHAKLGLAASPAYLFLIPPTPSRTDPCSHLGLPLGGVWQDLRVPGVLGCPLLCECCGVNHQGPITASIPHTAAVALWVMKHVEQPPHVLYVNILGLVHLL